jgi:hypothetical protein
MNAHEKPAPAEPLFPGVGKTDATLDWLAAHLLAAGGKPKARAKAREIVYSISREEVEAGDAARFLHEFGPDNDRRRLAQIRGRTHFTVSGYDEEEEEIFEIMEVRDYFALLHRLWPCWSFACSLRSPCLRAIALTLAPNVDVVREGRSVTTRLVECELAAFFEDGVPASLALGRLAGETRARAFARLKDVARYLDLA